MLTWMRDIEYSAACDTMEQHKVQHFNGVLWSTPLDLLGRRGICMHQHSTSDVIIIIIIK